MHILLLSRYGCQGASSRVRYLNYIDYFTQCGISTEVAPLFSNRYLKALYNNKSRLRFVVEAYIKRVLILTYTYKYDLVVVEKEMFPFMPALSERLLRSLSVPYLVDYDDALFHRYELHSSKFIRALLGTKIDVVMRQSSVVVAGNGYLAERAVAAGAAKVEVVPSVVSAAHYVPAERSTYGTPIVGWIGTPKTSRYLQPLIPLFESLSASMAVRFVAVGANRRDFFGTPVEVQDWSEDSEIESIQSFDVGIMPLPDNPWERGKCGYKLIQYMACGIPVIASPVGVNNEIVQNGKNGYLADSLDAWEVALRRLLSNADERFTKGEVGRKRVEAWYSLEVQAPRLTRIISAVARA